MQSLGTSAESENHEAELRVVTKVAPYLWPKGQTWVKQRVVLSIAALLAAKLIAVATPYLYTLAVDALAGEADASQLFILGAVGLTVA